MVKFQYIWVNTQKLIVTNLIGTYECKADAKGRLLLPISLKRQLGALVNENFILNYGWYFKN